MSEPSATSGAFPNSRTAASDAERFKQPNLAGGIPPVSAPLATTDRAAEFSPYGSTEKIKLSVQIVRNMLVKPTKQGSQPTDAQVMGFIMLCKTRRLNPFEGDCFIVGYDGKDGPEFSLITAHQAFLKRAEVSEQFDGMQSGVIVMGQDDLISNLTGDFVPPGWTLLGAWAKVHLKNRKFPMTDRLNLQSRAKDNAFWKRDPAGMIVKCVEASALRKSFPTILGGMYLMEESGAARLDEQLGGDVKQQTSTERIGAKLDGSYSRGVKSAPFARTDADGRMGNNAPKPQVPSDGPGEATKDSEADISHPFDQQGMFATFKDQIKSCEDAVALASRMNHSRTIGEISEAQFDELLMALQDREREAEEDAGRGN
jgi:phage recombination protein Bet